MFVPQNEQLSCRVGERIKHSSEAAAKQENLARSVSIYREIERERERGREKGWMQEEVEEKQEVEEEGKEGGKERGWGKCKEIYGPCIALGGSKRCYDIYCLREEEGRGEREREREEGGEGN